MKISKEEILQIADLSSLRIKEDEIEQYAVNLEDILNFANIVSKSDTEGIEVTVGANNQYNVFRKDEEKIFEEKELLIQNAPEQERGMFKIPSVI